jgi:tetratricopeptide (TPR) repeat protein
VSSETPRLNEVICPECGFSNRASFRVCHKCGTPLRPEKSKKSRSAFWLLGIFVGLITVLCVIIAGVWAFLNFNNNRIAEQHYQRAIACEQSEDWDCAVAEYEALIALRPNYEDAPIRLNTARQHQLEMHYQRGIALMESTEVADLQRAVEELEIAYELDPNYQEVAARLRMARNLLSQALTPSPTPTNTPFPTNTPLPTDTPLPTHTPTPHPTATPTPLPTDAPVPTPPPTPIPLPGLTILFQEDFNNPESGWEIEDDYVWDDPKGYENGEMVLDVHDDWAHARPHLTFDNFIMEVDGRWSGGAVGGSYRIVFRFQDWGNYYTISIGNDGRYEISKEAENDYSLLLEGFSDAIDRTGGINRFHIEANGHDFRFFINGQFLGNIHDVEHDIGEIVLESIKPPGAEFFEASFDNVVVAQYP